MSSPPRVVILSAGESARLGEAKALVELNGRAALTHLIEACGDPCPLIISGAHSKELASFLEQEASRREIELLEHKEWRAGRTSSIARAIRHAPGQDIILAPVDSPLVPRQVFDALRATWEAAGAPARGWLAPKDRRSQRHGHPIILGRSLLEEVLALKADAPLRSLRALAEPLLEVEVDAPEVLDNLDTPGELTLLRDRF